MINCLSYFKDDLLFVDKMFKEISVFTSNVSENYPDYFNWLFETFYPSFLTSFDREELFIMQGF